MVIKRYTKADEKPLFDLLIDEGEDWSDYHDKEGRTKYLKALEKSVTYMAYDEEVLCGYVRCKEDDGFGVYVYDLLVKKTNRGNNLGKMLMERVYYDFPDQTVYVMSDVDIYYTKLGYKKIGSIFQITK